MVFKFVFILIFNFSSFFNSYWQIYSSWHVKENFENENEKGEEEHCNLSNETTMIDPTIPLIESIHFLFFNESQLQMVVVVLTNSHRKNWKI